VKIIYLPTELKREILSLKWNVNGQRRRVSNVTLQAALNFQTQTPLANTLRAAALQRGGVTYDSNAKPKDYMPDCTTKFNRVGGAITGIEFNFHGRAVLTWYAKDNAATLATFLDTRKFENVVTVSDLMDVQFLVEQLANN